MSKTPIPPKTAPFLDKWGRSPRQDRRTVVNGEFVELVPAPAKPTRPVVNGKFVDETPALEIVREEIPNEPSESEKLQAELEPIAQIQDETIYASAGDVGEAFKFLVPPSFTQNVLDSFGAAGEAGDLLSGGGEVPASKDVLPGATGRVGEVEDLDEVGLDEQGHQEVG